jgi:FlaA1/EpsC-like NDP-sugar epimerase
MEQYPAEAIKNNVLATMNAVDLSARHRVQRFVLVSTDKAVDPSSVMGSTKRVSEMIVKGYASAKGASMVSVRFGNVLGSRGSVIPSMRRQIQNGQPVTVTDPEMVRYFMTVSEAAQLILQAGAIGGRGEVFVMDMGQPVRIMDLAQDLIRLCGLVPHRDVEIEIVGRRLGEKLNEDLLSRMEAIGARRNGQFYIAPAEPVRLSVLLSQINHLRVAAAADDKVQILRLLRTIVPEYRPSAAHALTADTPGRARAPVGGRT